MLNKLNIDSKIARDYPLVPQLTGWVQLGQWNWALEGAISGLAIGLMGVMTAILVPIVEWVMSLF